MQPITPHPAPSMFASANAVFLVFVFCRPSPSNPNNHCTTPIEWPDFVRIGGYPRPDFILIDLWYMVLRLVAGQAGPVVFAVGMTNQERINFSGYKMIGS